MGEFRAQASVHVMDPDGVSELGEERVHTEAGVVAEIDSTPDMGQISKLVSFEKWDSGFSLSEKGVNKHGKGENYNEPCGVGLELKVLVWTQGFL